MSAPVPITATVLEFPDTAPKWACVSIPAAKPLQIPNPNVDNSLANQ